MHNWVPIMAPNITQLYTKQNRKKKKKKLKWKRR